MVNFHENFVVATLKILLKKYLKYKTIFLIYVPMVIFQIFKKRFLRTIHILFGSFFLAFTLPQGLWVFLNLVLMGFLHFSH
jgi:hypothetical protein